MIVIVNEWTKIEINKRLKWIDRYKYTDKFVDGMILIDRAIYNFWIWFTSR